MLFGAVAADAAGRYTTARHRQEPDGWTKRRESVPNVTERRAVFWVDAAIQFGAYRQWRSGPSSTARSFRGALSEGKIGAELRPSSARVLAHQATGTVPTLTRPGGRAPPDLLPDRARCPDGDGPQGRRAALWHSALMEIGRR